MGDDAMLRADCANCIGLCCVLLAFDQGPLFGCDKPAGVACRHLDAADRCAIHAERDARGFAGCALYDCLGAGQAVTAMFAGRSWRDDPQTMRQMYDAFVRVREVNRLRLADAPDASAGRVIIRRER
jgi:hypothetical protein